MTLKEIVSKLTGIESRLSAQTVNPQELAALRGDLTALSSTVTQEVASRDTEITNLKSAATENAKQITDLTNQLGAATAKTARLEAESKSAGQQAADIIAGAGLPAGATPPAAPEATANEPAKMRGQYQELLSKNPTEAGFFYIKNRDKMFA